MARTLRTKLISASFKMFWGGKQKSGSLTKSWDFYPDFHFSQKNILKGADINFFFKVLAKFGDYKDNKDIFFIHRSTLDKSSNNFFKAFSNTDPPSARLATTVPQMEGIRGLGQAGGPDQYLGMQYKIQTIFSSAV